MEKNKYTKSGKHRYNIIHFDKNQNITSVVKDNINAKNVAWEILEYHNAFYDDSLGNRLVIKHDINTFGFCAMNDKGYTASLSGDRIDCVVAFVDMMQLEKINDIEIFKSFIRGLKLLNIIKKIK